MSELEEHLFCECDEFIREYRGPLSNETLPYYLKSEADKVIAEKDKEIRRLNHKYWNDKADEAAKMKRLIQDGQIIYLDEYCN